ncbi:MAG: aldehyde reductase [Bacteroidota bacterium]
MKKVLITGLSGFLASRTAIQLLDAGYEVIGSVRNLKKGEAVMKIIASQTSYPEHLSLVEADLMDADSWKTAVQGMDYVQHIASPFPKVMPKNDDDIVIPARDGCLNVLKAAAEAGVKRVVLTSSTGAIGYGKSDHQRKSIFTESDWTNTNDKKDSTAYFRSKTIAEHAAWDFIKSDQSGMELSVVCPGAILGPVLYEDTSSSINIVLKTMDGSAPAIPPVGFDMVDVRDVADLLIRAMEKTEAANQRYIGAAGYRSFKEVAEVLRNHLPGRKIPKRVLPSWALRLFAKLDKSVGAILIEIGAERKMDNSKAKQQLGWSPRTPEEAIKATADSIIHLKLA